MVDIKALFQKKILIVDDEESIRMVLSDLLKDEGYQVLTACDGVECMGHFVNETIDLVILDVDIEGSANGVSVLRTLKNHDRTRQIPVVMCSALATQSVMKQVVEMGAEDFIVKPFDLDEVLRRVKAILEDKTKRVG